jgi:magnesium and cobalt exporter, CNNM family
MTTQIIILFVLLVMSAVFSGIELAFFSLSDIKVRNLVDKKIKNATKVKKLKDNPEKLLITILIGNNVVNIGAASLATVLATDLFGSSGVGIATGVMTFLVLVFGEITPKSIANAKNEKISLLMARPLILLMYILYPIIVILELITKLISKLTGAEEGALVSEEELKTMAKMGVEEKAIEGYEGEMISKVFELNDITASDIMTVKSEMKVLDSKMKLCDALPEISSSPFSRIPIYENDKDNIIGVVYAKDVLKEGSKCIADPDKYDDENMKVIDVSRKPLFIPGNELINDLLKDFQKRHVQISLVVDESGSLLGLVTLEDVLEELVGEIIDETDIEKDLIKRLDKKNILVDGMTEIEDIVDFFNIKINASRKEFISKYLLGKFGKIPVVGDEIEIDDIIYFISDADEKKINKVKITKK